MTSFKNMQSFFVIEQYDRKTVKAGGGIGTEPPDAERFFDIVI